MYYLAPAMTCSNTPLDALSDLVVLCVDDSLIAREQLRQLVRRRVRQVIVAENGQQALTEFERWQPDIVISDLQMPVMDGLALAAEIKRKSPSIPFIMVTAYTETERLLAAIDLGVDRYLVKPIQPARLTESMLACALQLQTERNARLGDALIRYVTRPMIVVDTLDRIVRVSNSFLAAVGADENNLLGSAVASVLPSSDGGGHLGLRDWGHFKEPVQAPVRCPDGSTIMAEVHTEPLHDRQGRLMWTLIHLTFQPAPALEVLTC